MNEIDFLKKLKKYNFVLDLDASGIKNLLKVDHRIIQDLITIGEVTNSIICDIYEKVITEAVDHGRPRRKDFIMNMIYKAFFEKYHTIFVNTGSKFTPFYTDVAYQFSELRNNIPFNEVVKMMSRLTSIEEHYCEYKIKRYCDEYKDRDGNIMLEIGFVPEKYKYIKIDGKLVRVITEAKLVEISKKKMNKKIGE